MALFVRFRGFLIPACISLILLTAGAGYNLVWLPAQRSHLDDRNFRVLKNLSEQIDLSISALDKMIDNAAESGVSVDNTGSYLKNVAPTLEKSDYMTAKSALGSDYGDPPRLGVAADEGTNFLYLGFERDDSSRLAIRTDLDRLINKLIPSAIRCPFDAIIVAQSDGAVIYQQSSSGLVMARITALDDVLGDGHGNKTAAPANLETLSQYSRLVDVRLAGAQYRLYSQPLQLPFALANPSRPGKNAPAEASLTKPWILLGLVSSDRFRADCQTVPSTYMLLICALILLSLAVYPFLKLHISSSCERLRVRHVAAIAVGMSCAASILTFAMLDLCFCRRQLNPVASEQMQKLAEAIDSNFELEKSQAYDQLRRFYTDPELLSGLAHLSQDEKAPLPTLVGGGEQCNPVWVCRTNLRANQEGASLLDRYPYLLFATWSDQRGFQRIKWTTRSSMTPFLRLDDASTPYYPPIKRAFQTGGTGGAPTEGVGSLYSPNTGDNVTVFWMLMDIHGIPISDPRSSTKPSEWFCASLVTKPLSVYEPILMDGFQFAIVKSDGKVIYHSDRTRNLREDFVVEADQDKEVRGRVAMRAEGALTASYRGRPVRLYIHPMRGNSDDPWTVIVFRDVSAEETANFGIISIASLLFILLTCMALLAALVVFRVLSSERVRTLFWPDSRRSRTYGQIAAIHAAGSAFLLLLNWLMAPFGVLVWTLLISFVTLSVDVILISRVRLRSDSSSADDSSVPRHWLRSYLMMSVTAMLLVFVVPCLACFRTAGEFEQKLMVQTSQLKLAADIDEKTRALSTRDQSLTRSLFQKQLLEASGGKSIQVSYHEAGGTQLRLAGDSAWPQSERCGGATLAAQRRCIESFLSFLSPSYNQLAVDARILGQAGSADRWSWLPESAAGAHELVLATRQSRGCVLIITSPEAWSGSSVLLADSLSAGLIMLLIFVIARSTLRRIFLPDIGAQPAGQPRVIECDPRVHEGIFKRRPKAQKLALVQLAEEGLIHPKSCQIARELVREGLVARPRGVLAIQDACFAEFLKTALPRTVIQNWEREGNDGYPAWLRTSLLVTGIAVTGFLFYSQANALSAWITYLGGLAALIPACIRLLEVLNARREP